MFIIKGPYPAVHTTTVLPNPLFGDSQALTATVQTMRMMDGTLYTYVKSRAGRKRLRWDFEISRHKAIELREFLDCYQGSLLQVVDHDGVTWIGYLKDNPFEFTGASRAGDWWPGGETMTVILEFEER